MSARKHINRDGYFEDNDVTPAPLPEDFIETLSPATLDNVGYGGQALPVVRQADGTVQIGNFHLSATGLVIRTEVTQEEWEALYRGIQRVRRSLQWIVGDWMVYGEERGWLNDYEATARLTGLRPATVRDYTYVCRHIPPSIRIDKLKFAHFHLLAPLPDIEKQAWIDLAVEKKLSVRALRAAIHGTPDDDSGDMPPALPSSLDERGTKATVEELIQYIKEDRLKEFPSKKMTFLRSWFNRVYGTYKATNKPGDESE